MDSSMFNERVNYFLVVSKEGSKQAFLQQAAKRLQVKNLLDKSCQIEKYSFIWVNFL